MCINFLTLRQYAQRAGIEGTLSQGVRAFDLRRSRYMGLAKTHLQHILIAAAINLVRVIAWLTDPRPQKRRATPLAALASAA
jgi:transposase